ncbi:MAG: hypothetical protein QOH31_1392 [Verrucomicrobiota bacterium]
MATLAGGINGIQNLHELESLDRAVNWCFLAANRTKKVAHLWAEIVFPLAERDIYRNELTGLIFDDLERCQVLRGKTLIYIYQPQRTMRAEQRGLKNFSVCPITPRNIRKKIGGHDT